MSTEIGAINVGTIGLVILQDDPPNYEPYGIKNYETYRRLQETDEDGLYIRESNSAPLDKDDSREDTAKIAEAMKPSVPYSSDSQRAYDVFRPPGYQKPVRSGASLKGNQVILGGN